MAAISRDEPKGDIEANIYYGGWDMLARALGYPVYTPAAERAVARVIAELTDAGYIETLGKAGAGRRQAYLITVPDVFG